MTFYVVRNGWKKAQAGRVGRVRNGRERRSDGSRSVYRAVSCESEQEECVRAVLRRSLRRSSLAHLLEASLPLLLCLGSQSPLSIKPHSLKAGLSFLYTLT